MLLIFILNGGMGAKVAKNIQQLIAEAHKEVPEVHPYEVKDLQDGGEPFFLIDVRDGEELQGGALPGAIHASRGTLEMRIAQLVPDPGAKVVLFCAGGIRSLFAGRRLKEMGYADVSSMAGGFQGWQSSGFPFDTPSESRDAFERRLSAVFSADVKGYSRLMSDDEEATIRTLNACRKIMTATIEKFRGRVVDSPGDNMLAEFASVVDAVKSAIEIQKELKIQNASLPEDRNMEFRIGINLGDVISEGNRIYGDGVNIAARVESLADSGDVCISGTAYDQVENKLGLEFDFLGEQPVKNIAKPVRVFRIKLAE